MTACSDVTPGPNLFDSITYLKSPILTIVTSLQDGASDDISSHDLLDAYTTLSLRLRAIAPTLLATKTPVNALRAVSDSSESLGLCLQRDIRRAFDDPYTSQGTGILPRGVIGIAALQLDEDTFHTWRDACIICQSAILVATTILKFRVLHSLFPDHTLSRMFEDLLMVAQASEVPSLDSERTYAMAAGTFSTLQVSGNIVTSKKDTIILWMKELAECMSPSTVGSKIIHHLISTYPSIFLQDSVTLLPEVFSRLVTSDIPTRTDAAVALCGYARGLLFEWSSVRNKLKRTLLTHVRELLVSQLPISTKATDPKADIRLPQYLARAITEPPGTADDRGPRWATTVICCLIVLSGHHIFLSPRLCGFVLGIAERITTSKNKPLNKLLICVWRCLAWAFLQIHPDRDLTLPMSSTAKPLSGTRPQTSREVAFGIVKQEVRDGIGACLIAGLLYAGHRGEGEKNEAALDQQVDMAIRVLHEMVAHTQDRVYCDGVSLLARMLSAVGASGSTFNTGDWSPNDIVIKVLFTRHVYAAGPADFYSALGDACRFDESVVRPLSEHAIRHYSKELLEVWTSCVHRELQGDNFATLPDPLVHAWQALLLVQTQLTQECGHLKTMQEFANTPVDTVASFLRWTPRPSSRHPPAATAQHRVLLLCSQLWGVIRNVFSEAWLASAANALLTLTLQHTFDLSDEVVKAAWSRLCAALILMSAPEFVTRLVVEDEERRTIEIRRKLWDLTAQCWTSKDPPASWMDSADFLAIPIRYWSMAEDEAALWNGILNHALTLAASSSSASAFAVLEAVIDQGVVNVGPDRQLDAAKATDALLSRLRLEVNHEGLPRFLTNIGTVLVNLYTGTPEDISAALQLLLHVKRILHECPGEMLVVAIVSLAEGLSTWIGDRRELLLEQEYNSIVAPVYCEAVSALQDIPISPDTLHALAHFLYSAFISLPEPGHGPVAFHQFWTNIQPSLGDLNGAYPEEIKMALRACYDVFAIELPPDLPYETDSQTDSQAQGTSSSPVASPVPLGSSAGRLADTRAGVDALLTNYIPVHASSSPAVGSAWDSASAVSTPRRSKRHISRGVVEAESSPAGRLPNVHSSSDYMPSSPTDAVALRARRFAAGPSSRVAHERALTTPERPLKRPKLSFPLKSSRGLLSDTGGGAPGLDSRYRHRSRTAASATPRRSRRWRFDGVEVESYRGHRSRTSTSPAGPSIPKAAKRESAKTKEELLSPEVPSPATAARAAAAPSSDDYDYDAWEVPMRMDGDMDTDPDVVPDSQPPGEGEEWEDSLVPSFMNNAERARSLDSTVVFSDDLSYADDMDNDIGNDVPSGKALGKRPQHPPAIRMRTAPASFMRDPSPAAEHAAVPLRRARTGSAHLKELRNVYDALEQDGSQLPVDEMLAATALANRLGTLLSEKLTKKLHGADVRAKK